MLIGMMRTKVSC